MMDAMAPINLPYIERNKSRYGQIRYYFRRDGRRICRLPDDPDTEEFATAYWKMRDATDRTGANTGGPIHLNTRRGSFRWLCLEYMRRDAFRSLDVTTQAKRRAIMESMWAEPVKLSRPDGPTFADMPIAALDAHNVEVLRDRKRETPFAADERLKVLRQAMETKDDAGRAYMRNSAKLVAPFRKKTEGHHAMTPAEAMQFISHHGPQSKATFALALMMFTGFRVSDLAAIGPQHRRGDIFRLRLFKNRNRTPVDLEIAIHPILEAVLAMHKPVGLNYLLTEHGKPYSVKGLGNRISEWFTQAGLANCTAHSVRKGLATDIAHHEATDSQLEAMFGWSDGKTSKIYTRSAQRARLARQAVARINWDGIGSKFLASEGVESEQTATPTDTGAFPTATLNKKAN